MIEKVSFGRTLKIEVFKQLKISVLSCLNIADELFSAKKKHNKVLDNIKSESQLILEFIENKIK